MELIPGLPDDLARECLFRLPFGSFPFLLPVSKAWNRQIRSPKFHQHRILKGHARPVFILPQPDRVLLFDPKSGVWVRLPKLPGPAHPEFKGVVNVGSNKILAITNMVHVFDFFTGQWRRGADMPGRRANFRLSSDRSSGKALVAGGQHGKERVEATMYDVASDEWIRLGDMAKGRESCSVVFHAGRFHVMGGGRLPSFEVGSTLVSHVESLDPEGLEWGPVREEGVHEFCGVIVGDGEELLYSIYNATVYVRRDGAQWEVLAELPQEVRCRSRAVASKDLMLVNGVRLFARHDDPFTTYMLHIKSGEWCKVDMPHGYSSIMLQKGCAMDL